MSQSVHQKGVYCGMRVLALFLAYVERELAIGSNLHNDTSSWFQISLRSEVAGDPWRDCSRDEESALLPTGSWLVENLNEVIDTYTWPQCGVWRPHPAGTRTRYCDCCSGGI